jgi:hypothetical protein
MGVFHPAITMIANIETGRTKRRLHISITSRVSETTTPNATGLTTGYSTNDSNAARRAGAFAEHKQE